MPNSNTSKYTSPVRLLSFRDEGANMFADLVNKIACRTYAVLCFFYGVFGIACGAIGIHWAVNGIPPSVAAEMTATISMPAVVQFLPWLSGGFVVFGVVFITLGVFAWLRYISAMIVGCAFWTLSLGRSMIHDTGALDTDGFAVVNGIAFVSLTIVAAITARRRRSAPQQPPSPSA